MKKMTEEEFNKILNSYNTEDEELQIEGILLVTTKLNSSYLSDIPNYYKNSLIRKVLRYVAKTAMSDIDKLNKIAYLGAFYEMKDGEQVLFKKYEKDKAKHRSKC